MLLMLLVMTIPIALQLNLDFVYFLKAPDESCFAKLPDPGPMAS